MASLDGPIAEIPASPRNAIKLGGNWWQTNPWVSNAGDLEERYGEEGPVAGYAVPAVTLSGDVLYNAGRAAKWVYGYLPKGGSPYRPWFLPDMGY